jgi:hypothetical protein
MFSGSDSYSRDATLQPCDRITDSSFDRVIPRAQCGQIACPSMQQWRLMCPCLSLLTGIKSVVRDCHNQQWPAATFRLTAVPAFGDAWTTAPGLHQRRRDARSACDLYVHCRTGFFFSSLRLMSGSANVAACHYAISPRQSYELPSRGLPTGSSAVSDALAGQASGWVEHLRGPKEKRPLSRF